MLAHIKIIKNIVSQKLQLSSKIKSLSIISLTLKLQYAVLQEKLRELVKSIQLMSTDVKLLLFLSDLVGFPK